MAPEKHQQSDHIPEILTPVPEASAMMFAILNQTRDLNARFATLNDEVIKLRSEVADLAKLRAEVKELIEERTRRRGIQDAVKWVVDTGWKLVVALAVMIGWMIAEKKV